MHCRNLKSNLQDSGAFLIVVNLIWSLIVILEWVFIFSFIFHLNLEFYFANLKIRALLYVKQFGEILQEYPPGGAHIWGTATPKLKLIMFNIITQSNYENE